MDYFGLFHAIQEEFWSALGRTNSLLKIAKQQQTTLGYLGRVIINYCAALRPKNPAVANTSVCALLLLCINKLVDRSLISAILQVIKHRS